MAALIQKAKSQWPVLGFLFSILPRLILVTLFEISLHILQHYYLIVFVAAFIQELHRTALIFILIASILKKKQ